MKAFVWVSRIFVGVLFIISGLIKANDPVGFSYKLKEYFEVFGTEFMVPMSLSLAIFICIFEVVCGIATIFGSRMKFFSWMLLLMIVFFTFLTFYSAYFNKVTDCGCFGDAVKLTPWQSFTKDIILLIFITPIFLYRKKILPIFKVTKDNLILTVGTIATTVFTLYCLWHLPVLDFRPYKVGTNLLKAMEIPEGAKPDVYKTTLVYQKDGVKKEFTTETYPWQDSTWVWVETKNVLVEKGYQPAIHDFSLTSPDGVDQTQALLGSTKELFLLVEYNVNKADLDVQPDINKLAASLQKDSIKFIALTASLSTDIEKFRHANQTAYDFYTTDEKALQTMIRSNPGLVYIKNGVVVDMWHANDLPTYEKLKEKYLK
ncbi:MAG: BT_3928 family protein [Bacteroidota bacterium]